MRTERWVPGRRPVLLGMVALLAWCVSPISALARHEARTVPAQRLVLSVQDVTRVYGSGFVRTSALRITKRMFGKSLAAPGTSNGRLSAVDFVTGYEAYFARTQTPSPTAVTTVISTVDEYANDHTPRLVFHLLPQSNQPAAPGMIGHKVAIGSVGNQAYLEALTWRGSGPIPTSAIETIVFRRGRYLASVLVISMEGTPQRSALLWLAQMVDARLKAAG